MIIYSCECWLSVTNQLLQLISFEENRKKQLITENNRKQLITGNNKKQLITGKWLISICAVYYDCVIASFHPPEIVLDHEYINRQAGSCP